MYYSVYMLIGLVLIVHISDANSSVYNSTQHKNNPRQSESTNLLENDANLNKRNHRRKKNFKEIINDTANQVCQCMIDI